MDLKGLSGPELKKLKAAIEREIDVREKSNRSKALGEIKSIVAKYGMKLSDVIGRNSRRANENEHKPRPKKAAAHVNKAAKKIAYRHPENPQLTWSGGRGRRPQWVKDWELSGRSLDETKVA